MDQTPDEARVPDEDRRGEEDDPTALRLPHRQLPSPDEDDDGDEVGVERRATSRRGTMSSRRLTAAAVAVVVLAGGGAALALNGNGGGDGEDDDTASSSATADATEWERIVPGGDCVCADGSEFAFWERRADPTKVVFYLDGGGVCTDATTCAFTGTAGESEFYNWSVEGENPAFPGGGILDFDRPDNPFADYSFIYVPSCTGDVYLGDVTREYSPELTVEHKGYVDGTATLNYLAEHYPDATQVVVVGKTGGSVAAPVYGGLAADLLPDAQVTVFGAQSGAFPDDPDFNAAILGELWGAYDTMPDWEVNEGLTARDWGIPRFWIQAGLHDPDIVMARFDYAFDPNAAAALESLGVDASTLALIDANEAAIEAAGVVQHSYTAPGREHGILDLDRFYEIEVNGVRLVDWVDALIAGDPLDDVHCDDCRTG
jgi:hypothetical protein